MTAVAEEAEATVRVVQLTEAVEISPKPERGSLPDDLEVSFVPMAAVEATTGRMDASAVRKYAELKKGYTYFSEGDVLFAKITPCMENGKMAVARGLRNGIGCGSTEFHVLRPRSGVDAHYIYHFVSSARFRAEAAHSMTAAVGQKRMPASFLEKQSIPLPDLDEQRRIVAEVEKQFSRFDEAVANLKHVKANLKRYKAAVLKAAVEGRLVPTEAELARREARNYETGADLLARVLKQREKREGGEGKFRDPLGARAELLATPPIGWTWATPDQLAKADSNSICAGPFGTIFKARDFRPSGVPIIFLRHVAPGMYLTQKPGFMDRAKWEELFKPYSVFGGELLITKLGDPPGACCIYPPGIGPAMVTPDVIKVSVNEAAVQPKFLMYCLNSEIIRRFTTGAAFGTTRLRLTLPLLRATPVLLPPMAEQHRIVAEIERRFSIADDLNVHTTANIHRAQSARQSILRDGFGQGGS